MGKSREELEKDYVEQGGQLAEVNPLQTLAEAFEDLAEVVADTYTQLID